MVLIRIQMWIYDHFSSTGVVNATDADC